MKSTLRISLAIFLLGGLIGGVPGHASCMIAGVMPDCCSTPMPPDCPMLKEASPVQPALTPASFVHTVQRVVAFITTVSLDPLRRSLFTHPLIEVCRSTFLRAAPTVRAPPDFLLYSA